MFTFSRHDGPDMPDLRDARRLLIIRLSSIGDVVHALPVSAALGEAYPRLEITWLVEEMSADIVNGNSYLTDVIVIPRSRWKRGRWNSPRVWKEYATFLADLRRRNFDVTLDLQGYAKSAIMAFATGAPRRYGWWRLRDGANLVSRALPHSPDSLHRVDWYLDVARSLGAAPSRVCFPIHIPDVARNRVADLLQAGGIEPAARYVALNPAVGSGTRRWGAGRFAECIARIGNDFGLPTVLVGSQKDGALCEEVAKRAFDAGLSAACPPVNLAGQTNLKELAALLDRCAVHLCGDTGSGHIAAALKRPVVALYGPTDPEHAGPWGQPQNVLSHRELCRPGCGASKCLAARAPGEAAECLAAITPKAVLDKVEDVLYGATA